MGGKRRCIKHRWSYRYRRSDAEAFDVRECFKCKTRQRRWRVGEKWGTW